MSKALPKAQKTGYLRSYWAAAKRISHYRKAFIILVVLSYALFVVAYMGPSVWRCGDTLAGIGDSTGGPIWRASLTPKQPLLGGFEKVTNFPYGENLYSPVGYASIEQTLLMRAADKVVGPVCAYNVVNILGFMSTAIIMCAFIYYLLKSRWIAWLAGYAVAFTPYAQSKVGGHPSYGYAGLLILVLWLALHTLTSKKWKFGIWLAAVLAICAYFDPYFILLSGTVLVPVLAVWAIRSAAGYRNSKTTRMNVPKTLKLLSASFICFLVLIAPLMIVRIKDAKVINATTSAVRGNIEMAAMQCSNFPLDYILPDPYNMPLIRIYGLGYTARNINLRHWCGPGESRVSISITILGLVSLGSIILVWEKLNSRSLKLRRLLSYEPGLFIWSTALIAVMAFLLGMPPRINGVLMPSGMVIMFTQTWRIFAREYLVLNLAVVILFAVILKYLYQSIGIKMKRASAIVFLILVALIVQEYQIHDYFSPFTFSYKRDVPQIYRQIKDDPAINAIAEYPLDRAGIESDTIVYYVTMQKIHQKSLLNSAAAADPNEKLHIAMKDLSDPQTIPILRALGIKYITVHGLTPEQVLSKTDQLEIIKIETPIVYGLTMVRAAPINTIILAKIKDGPGRDYAVTMKKGFAVNMTIMRDPVDMEYENLPDSELTVTPLFDDPKHDPVDACFDVKMAAKNDVSDVSVSVNGEVRYTFTATDNYSQVMIKAAAGDTILIHNDKLHNLRLDNLGCPV